MSTQDNADAVKDAVKEAADAEQVQSDETRTKRRSENFKLCCHHGAYAEEPEMFLDCGKKRTCVYYGPAPLKRRMKCLDLIENRCGSPPKTDAKESARILQKWMYQQKLWLAQQQKWLALQKQWLASRHVVKGDAEVEQREIAKEEKMLKIEDVTVEKKKLTKRKLDQSEKSKRIFTGDENLKEKKHTVSASMEKRRSEMPKLCCKHPLYKEEKEAFLPCYGQGRCVYYGHEDNIKRMECLKWMGSKC